MKNILITAFFAWTLTGCYYDNEEELYPSQITCDTTNVTYSNTVKGIVDFSCTSCHNPNNKSGNVDLSNHAALAASVNSGKFLSSIVHDGKASKMPQGAPKLDACKIEKIKNWINKGALNN
jgi:hypothetical protein